MRVVIRVDGGPEIGLGHAMRCATLATVLRRRDVAVDVVTAGLADRVSALFRGVGARVHHETGVSITDRWIENADLLLVDGYHLGPEIERLASTDCPIAMIDDNRELPVQRARLVLNQNLHATDGLYGDISGGAVVLTGARYALLRDDVLRLVRHDGSSPVRHLLITMGGADPTRLTAPLVAALGQISGVGLTVAIRRDHPDIDLVDLAVAESNGRIRLDPGDLVAGFAAADLAVIGGGTTMYEVGYLGIPSVAAVIAENQRAGAAAASARGFVVAVEPEVRSHVDEIERVILELIEDGPARERMSRAGRSVFDGRGAERVADAMIELARRGSPA